MTKKTFALVARVSTENPEAVGKELKKLVPKGIIEHAEKEFLIKAEIIGESARDLNRDLLSALRRVEKKTRLRAEWTNGKITERFFDYVPKGSRKV